ncbi:tRNA lysidine(34) synthetase TilS [Rhizobium sp. ARZ01]|nr:tRNA lysidine(34) synthetase TilS [Rhizobium sp. ARZ01]
MDETVAHFLKSFQKPARLLVAVSGGGDSVGLLLALDDALKTGGFSGFSLIACTVDHALRAGSADEALWVAALCARRGILHVVRRWDGPKPEAGIQARAREARHALLAEAARSHDADAIVTAHNLDDQRETIAMRKARRSDGVGLAGIAPATLLFGTHWVLRPLLGTSRANIRGYLKGIGQDWLEDPSNVNRNFERVRIRVEGASEPTLRGEAAEGAGQAAAEVRARMAREGAAFLSREFRAVGADLAWLPVRAIMSAMDDEAHWRALLAVIAVLGGRAHLLEADAGDRLKVFLASGRLSRMTAGRVVFDRRREGLYLYREHRGIAPATVAPFDQTVWDGRWRVQNLSGTELLVRSAMDEAALGSGEGDVPMGVVRRAARSSPLVLAGDTQAGDEHFALEPVLAPYDRYLPVFDLPLAQAIAGLFGRAPYPAPPIP